VVVVYPSSLLCDSLGADRALVKLESQHFPQVSQGDPVARPEALVFGAIGITDPLLAQGLQYALPLLGVSGALLFGPPFPIRLSMETLPLLVSMKRAEPAAVVVSQRALA
jgi:hypothetical protein